MDNEEVKEPRKKNKGRWKWVVLVAAILIVTNFAAFFVGTKAAMAIPGMGVSNKDIAKSLEGINDVSKFKKLFQVRDVLYKLYDGEIDEDALVEGAIKGMTNSLNDPYTVFMNKKEFSDFNEKNEGNYVGVGLQVAAKDEDIVVIAVFAGSPAEKAGIKPGDKIKKVADTDVSGKDLEKAVALMKNGKVKERVDITLDREGKGLYTTEVYRDTIVMQTVAGEMIDGNIGYINPGLLKKGEIDKIMTEFMNTEGLIIDLRYYPSDFITKSLAEYLLPQEEVFARITMPNRAIPGEFIFMEDQKSGKDNKDYYKGKVIIINNECTQSNAEFTTMSFRNSPNSLVIGENTIGADGDVAYFKLPGGITTVMTGLGVYNPDGSETQRVGLTPDIYIKPTIEGIREGRDELLEKSIDLIKE